MTNQGAFSLRRAASIVLLLALSTHAPAQDPILAMHSNDIAPGTLYTVDVNTGATVKIADLSQPVTGAAFNPMNRKVYLISNDDTLGNPILVWDPATQTETQFPGIGVDYARMGCSADGWVYGVKLNSPQLYRINPNNGATVLLGSMNTDTAGSSGDLAFAPGATDEFYYLVSTKFYLVDLNTLNATVLSPSPIPSPTGLAFSEDGRLWMSDNDFLYEVDTSTGSATQVGPFNRPRIIELAGALAPILLKATPETVSPGDPLMLRTGKGVPGGLVGTVVVSLNGAPMYQPILFRLFDAQGVSTINAITPNLVGNTVGMVSLGFATSGRLIQTAEERVTIQ